MFDFKFDWNESINTGLEIIDEQHKELFKIARSIEQLLITHCIGVEEKLLLQIICDLREYVAYHFYEEERLMSLYGVAEEKEHVKEHQYYRNIILEINVAKVGSQPFIELTKIQENIKKLVMTHMISWDKRMAEELIKKGVQK